VKLPDPIPGLVICHSYLWHREHRKGSDEGRKNRPAAIILSSQSAAGKNRVYLLAITHSPPRSAEDAVEIPTAVNHSLGLDDVRSWIVIDEFNEFVWPGYDLHLVPGKRPSTVAFGVLPPAFFAKVRDAFLDYNRKHRARAVSRD
jgi:hypothetical protein